jgi:hypothetical protein
VSEVVGEKRNLVELEEFLCQQVGYDFHDVCGELLRASEPARPYDEDKGVLEGHAPCSI